MNIVLVTNGSRGDIHPFISIGIALKQRGHSVTLVSIDLYRALATESGLNFIASDDGEQYRKLERDGNPCR